MGQGRHRRPGSVRRSPPQRPPAPTPRGPPPSPMPVTHSSAAPTATAGHAAPDEPIAQPLSGLGQPMIEGRHGPVQSPGGLLVGQALQVAEDDRQAMGFGQPVDLLVQDRARRRNRARTGLRPGSPSPIPPTRVASAFASPRCSAGRPRDRPRGAASRPGRRRRGSRPPCGPGRGTWPGRRLRHHAGRAGRRGRSPRPSGHAAPPGPRRPARRARRRSGARSSPSLSPTAVPPPKRSRRCFRLDPSVPLAMIGQLPGQVCFRSPGL